MKGYLLLLSGELLPGADRLQAQALLADVLRIPPAEAADLLRGQPLRLTGFKSLQQAEQIRARLAQAGVECQVHANRPEPTAPPTAAELFQRPSDLDLHARGMRCPKCGAEQPPAEICRVCGIVIAKYRPPVERLSDPARPLARRPEADPFPYHLVHQLLLLVFLSSTALALWSHWKKDQLPEPSFYDMAQLGEPLQTATEAAPFGVDAHGVHYLIEPLFDYALDGIVVSLHDSDVFWDIYHTKDWQDFINIRDLCVVWGDNVASGVFRRMHYANTTWTCWVDTKDAEAAARFVWPQLSNNHLLTADPEIARAIKSAEIGDQIHFSGKLARYSHAGGFQRGTSTSRLDTGNGACETIYVDSFDISRKSNPGWRLIYKLSFGLSVLALLGLGILLFVAPVRAPRG